MGQKRQIAGMRTLITGASQGIGRSLAIEAGKRGAKLVIMARSNDLLTLADELRKSGVDVEAVLGDITKPEDRKRAIDAAVDRFGGLDILINNAGIGATGHFMEASVDRLRQIFEVNVFALAEMIRLAVPVLRKGNKPVIVNISSGVGKRALPARSEYSASKYAVQGLSDALRAEFVRFGIDLCVVAPGLTATNFPKNMIENKAKVPLDHLRAMTSDQVAILTLQTIEKGKNEVVLTWQAKAISIVNRFFPRFVDWMMARKVRQLYKDEIAQSQAGDKNAERQEVGAAS